MKNCIQLLLFTFLACLSLTSAKELTPVIIVPGYGCSRLQAKLDKPKVPHPIICEKHTKHFINIWFNPGFLLPLIKDCWEDTIRLIYDPKTRTTSSPPGVETRAQGFGDASVLISTNPALKTNKAGLPGYKNIIDAFKDKGYVDTVNLRGASYDFRKAANELLPFFDQLKGLVEETYEKNKQTRVAFVAHSMGGLLSSQFFQRQPQQWKDKYIAGLISLGAVYGGSVKSLKYFAFGGDLGFALTDEHQQREVQSTWPGLAYIAPAPGVFDPDQIFIDTLNPPLKVSLNTMEQSFRDMKCPDCAEIWKDILPFKSNHSAPGVEVHCLHGVDVPTIEKMITNRKDPEHGDPEEIYGDGDGTVGLKSLNVCARWNKTQTQKIYHVTFSGINHSQIKDDKDIVQKIVDIVAGF